MHRSRATHGQSRSLWTSLRRCIARRFVPLLAALLAAGPSPGQGQRPEAPAAIDFPQRGDVVSSRIHMSNTEASLYLELANGEQLTVRFADGLATANGAPQGAYDPQGAAELAWRDLLDRLMSLSGVPLTRELNRWDPDGGLEGEDLELLRRIDATLSQAISERAANESANAVSDDAPTSPTRMPPSSEGAIEAASDAAQDLTEAAHDLTDAAQDLSRLREEIRREVENELQREMSRRDSPWWQASSRALRAVGDTVATVFVFLILGALALVLMRLAGLRLDYVAREIGHRPGRAAAVGFAGGFLLVPLFVIGIVALAVSLIGIPLIIVWVPAFPLAVALGGFMGFVGASQHVGAWVLDQNWSFLDRVNRHRDAHVRLTGLAALLFPFVAGNLLGALPLIGWIGGLVTFLGVVGMLIAATVGFGAVIVTRGGKYGGPHWSEGLDDAELDTASAWADGHDSPPYDDDAADTDEPGRPGSTRTREEEE